MNQSKVEAILNLIEPKSKKELRSFLGMVNYYAPHIPRLPGIAGPLNLLTGVTKNKHISHLAKSMTGHSRKLQLH